MLSTSSFRFRLLIILCLVWMVFAAAGCARMPVEAGAPFDDFTAYLDREIPALLSKYRVPGLSLALIQDGELAWSGAYGYADLEGQREMTVDAVCRAESISKSVTAWGVMKLVEGGQIELDAPVERYLAEWQLPDTEFDDGDLTVRLLLSNQAGLPPGTIGEEYAPGVDRPSLPENLTQEARLVQEPGMGFIYSNPGFNLLELMVEDVTGQDFSSYMENEVLRPLGMEGTSYSWRDEYQGRLPAGYEMDGTPVPAYVYPASASGGLFADVEDLARFVSAEMAGEYAPEQSVLNSQSIRTLQEPQVKIPGLFSFVAEAYGFGHFIETLPDGRKAVWHGGQGHGWMTHFHAIPSSGDGIVILTNSQRSWPLIAEVLSDWAHWNGFGPLKFSIITAATRIVQGIIVLIFTASVLEAIWLAGGVRSGRRKFAPFARRSLPGRSAQALIGAAVIGILVWSWLQPYLFLSSILPGSIRWLFGSLAGLAGLNILAACFPRDGEKEDSKSGGCSSQAGGSQNMLGAEEDE
jgi:CubicO group peptidase (beta-lactamase class C family)